MKHLSIIKSLGLTAGIIALAGATTLVNAGNGYHQTQRAFQSSAKAEQRWARQRFESIVGSWKVVSDNDGSIFFGTYDGGLFQGTVQFTSPNTTTSLTHGNWKRTGPRTFSDTDSGFLYDPVSGEAVSIITFRASIEVDKGGDTASFDIAFDITELDGTPIDSGTNTATGTRIAIQPLAAE